MSMMIGTGTQIYAEDKMLTLIQSTFNLCFDYCFWNRFLNYYNFTLDGSTGVVVEDLTNKIKNFNDIKHVFVGSDTLSKMGSNINPFTITGADPLYYIPTNNEKIFKIVPFTSSANIVVSARIKPDDFTFDSEVPFDEDAIIFGVCYEFSVDDDDNRVAAQKFSDLFQKRLQTLRSIEDTGEYSLSQSYGITTAWENVY